MYIYICMLWIVNIHCNKFLWNKCCCWLALDFYRSGTSISSQKSFPHLVTSQRFTNYASSSLLFPFIFLLKFCGIYTYHLFSAILILCSSIQVTFRRFVFCPTTGPLSFPKRVIYRVRSSVSSFSLQTGIFTLLDSFTLEDGTDMLSRNVGN
jgi:hypothetical protein